MNAWGERARRELYMSMVYEAFVDTSLPPAVRVGLDERSSVIPPADRSEVRATAQVAPGAPRSPDVVPPAKPFSFWVEVDCPHCGKRIVTAEYTAVEVASEVITALVDHEYDCARIRQARSGESL